MGLLACMYCCTACTAGKVYFLEINPNCGIFYPKDAMGSADYILSHDPQVGCSFRLLVSCSVGSLAGWLAGFVYPSEATGM